MDDAIGRYVCIHMSMVVQYSTVSMKYEADRRRATARAVYFEDVAHGNGGASLIMTIIVLYALEDHATVRPVRGGDVFK